MRCDATKPFSATVQPRRPGDSPLPNWKVATAASMAMTSIMMRKKCNRSSPAFLIVDVTCWRSRTRGDSIENEGWIRLPSACQPGVLATPLHLQCYTRDIQ